MWRDILLATSFALALLTYFGITPRRLSGYAKTAKSEVTKRTSTRRWRLSFAVAFSLVYIFVFAFADSSLAMALRIIAASGSLWFFIIVEAWELEEKWGHKVMLAGVLILVVLFVVGYALSDMTLLEKVVYPAGTFGVAFVYAAIRTHVMRKREGGYSSQEDTKDSAL